MAVPKRRQCGTQQVHERLCEEHPTFRARQNTIEQGIRRSIERGIAQRVARQLIKIRSSCTSSTRPARRTSPTGRSRARSTPSTATMARRTRTELIPDPWKGLAANPNIQFALAKKDPNGKATTGITRTQTTRASFGTGDTVKTAAGGGHPAWPANRYLNLWACTLGGGLLGYAQFPGGPAKTDGVVILNTAFGTTGTASAPFDLGRTATHEVGHWLNLRHIWGDRNDCGGTDFVTDTPNAQLPNYGKPTFPHISCNNAPNGDMFMDYMDYVDDAAMVMFTAGQVERMNATLAGARKKIGR